MKYSSIYTLSLMIVMTSFFSCKNNQIEQLFFKEVCFPDTLHYITNNPDVIAKMVVYFDSTVCASCQLSRLWEWDETSIITKATKYKFQTIFIFSPAEANLAAVQRATQAINSKEKNILIDENQDFVRLNPFLPEESVFHTFLLNKNNEIVLIGNPVNNSELWGLYKKIVRELINNGGILPHN